MGTIPRKIKFWEVKFRQSKIIYVFLGEYQEYFGFSVISKYLCAGTVL